MPEVPVSGHDHTRFNTRSLHQFLVKDHQKEEPFLRNRYEPLQRFDTFSKSSKRAHSNFSTRKQHPRNKVQVHDPPLFLDLIGRQFEFSKDNAANSSTTLSKWQRRRRCRTERQNIARYSICEFGSEVPLNRIANHSKYKQANINSLFYRVEPNAPDINVISTGSATSGNSTIKGSRLLNPNNKNDRKRLFKMKRNLETLKRMSTHANTGTAFQTYRELRGRPVKLKTTQLHEIPANDFILIPLAPEFPNQLQDKLWVAHQHDSKNNNFSHKKIHIVSTIVDKSISEKNQFAFIILLITGLGYRKIMSSAWPKRYITLRFQ